MKKKRFLLTMCLCVLALTANAYDFEADGIYYIIVSDASCAVIGSADETGGIVIPERVTDGEKSYVVTEIADGAFRGSGVTSVTIPNSVTEIGALAFCECFALTSVNFPSSLKTIGMQAFQTCYRLGGDVVFSDGLEEIGAGAFGLCGLTSVTIPASVTSIGEAAFFCSSASFKSVTMLGTTPCECGKDAFGESDLIIHVPAGAGKTYKSSSSGHWYDYRYLIDDGTIDADFEVDGIYYKIKENGFVEVTSKAQETASYRGEIEIPEYVTFQEKEYNVQGIGDNAFGGCGRLSSVECDGEYLNVGKEAFYGCEYLISLDFVLGNVGDLAFYGCSNLNQVAIDGNIGTEAFEGCGSLEAVSFGSNVKSIGAMAFALCSSLTSVEIPKGIRDINVFTFTGCTNLMSVKIPDGVTSISIEAFSGCSSLVDVTIPSSVTTLMAEAFGRCDNLKTVTMKSATPCEMFLGNPFYGCTSLETIYVPYGSGASYKAAEGWSDYASKIVEMSAGPGPSGDVNGDGNLTMGDVVTVVNDILNVSQSGFDASEADVNGDGKVTMGDVVKMVNIMLGNDNPSKASSMRRQSTTAEEKIIL